MARKSKDWTDARLKRVLKEGRGQGEEEYKPWIEVADIPSRGRVTRIFSSKMNRVMHLLSDMQAMYYYLLEFDESVINVKEQYPLLDIGDIVDHLDESLLKRLKNSDGTPLIIVTTFLITARNENGELYSYARSIKDRNELEKRATLERLEIQRRYYESRNIDWAIVTAEEINKQKARNVEWVLPTLKIEDFGLSYNEVNLFSPYLVDVLQSSMDPIRVALQSFERAYKLMEGTGLTLFRYLIASRRIEVNMNKPIDLNMNSREIDFSIVGE